MNPFLSSSRLIIQKPIFDDFADLYHLQTTPEVMAFVGNGVREKNEVRVGLEKAIRHYEKHQFSLGSVYLKDSQRFIGRAGLIYLNYDDQQPHVELAYALLPEFWGKGYATELAKSLVIWGFAHLSIQKLIAVVHPENKLSQNVLEKSGMSKTGLINYGNKQLVSYEILNQQNCA